MRGGKWSAAELRFPVEDAIKWPVAKGMRLNTPVQVGTIDYCYEAHDSSWQKLFVLEGVVENIKILYQRYAAASEDSRLMPCLRGDCRSQQRKRL